MGESSTQASLSQITNADGTSNTAFLGHKFMEPQYYGSAGGSPNDGPNWAQDGNYNEHKRSPFYFYQDTNGLFEGEYYMGGPHPNVCPSLFADGSVRNISYNQTTDIYGALWGYDDGISLGGSATGN
jgi:prepilin-type processing-associated H-X9-DG protein